MKEWLKDALSWVKEANRPSADRAAETKKSLDAMTPLIEALIPEAHIPKNNEIAVHIRKALRTVAGISSGEGTKEMDALVQPLRVQLTQILGLIRERKSSFDPDLEKLIKKTMKM